MQQMSISVSNLILPLLNLVDYLQLRKMPGFSARIIDHCLHFTSLEPMHFTPLIVILDANKTLQNQNGFQKISLN